MPLRRWLCLITLLLGVALPSYAQQASLPGQVFSNIGGLLIASNFNEWSIPQGTTPTNSQIQWTNNKMCQPTSGGTTFQAFQVGSPITIVDANTANTETVIVTSFNSNNYGCQIQAVMTHTHYSYRIQSATAGLQEAINAADGLPYEVLVTPDWARAGGITSQITNAQGNTNVTILDQRTSVIVPYLWNGSNYVATPFGAGASCGAAGLLQASAGVGSGFTCDPSITLNTTTHNLTTPYFNGIAQVTPSMITGGLDAFGVINAVAATLPSGSLVDATALGAATYVVATQLTALNQSGKAIELLLNPGTIFTINTSFSSPTNTPASCAVPVGGQTAVGSSIVVPGFSSFNGNFQLGPFAKVQDVVCNGDFTGSQETMRLDGVVVQGNASATVMGALVHLAGIFIPTRIANSGTYHCYAQCLEVDAGTTGTGGPAIGAITFDNDDWFDGGTGTYPGSVVQINALNSSGEATNLVFLGGGIQDNGPHNPLLVINGHGGGQTKGISFVNVEWEMAAATSSVDWSNVDPIQLTDASNVTFNMLRMQGAWNAAQVNMIDISQTTGSNSFGIYLDNVSAPIAEGFTCLVSNAAEGTCDSGFTAASYTAIPPYRTGDGFMPVTRQTNTVPPTGSNCGGLANGTIWTNSLGTTLSTTRYTCVNGSWTGG